MRGTGRDGAQMFPYFRPWLEENVEGMDIDETNPPQESIELPPATRNEGTAAKTKTTTTMTTTLYRCSFGCACVLV